MKLKLVESLYDIDLTPTEIKENLLPESFDILEAKDKYNKLTLGDILRICDELFDNVKMAKWLTEITKDPYDAQHLPKFDFKFVKNETAIRFYVTSTEQVDDETKDDDSDKVDTKETDSKITDSTKTDKKKKPKAKKVNKVYHFEYVLGSNGLTVIDNKKKDKEEWKKWANIAPDSSVVLFSKHYNLYWMDKENFLKAVKNEKDTTIVEHQWTKDGELYDSYGGPSGRGETNESM